MYDAISGYVVTRMQDSILIGPKDGDCGFTHRVIVISPEKFELQSHIHLITHMAKSDYADTLYGFSNHGEIMLFKDLLEADGIGPKAALSVLRMGKVEDIKQAIRMGRAEYIRQAKGINKGADAIILKLGKRYSNEEFAKQKGIFSE